MADPSLRRLGHREKVLAADLSDDVWMVLPDVLLRVRDQLVVVDADWSTNNGFECTSAVASGWKSREVPSRAPSANRQGQLLFTYKRSIAAADARSKHLLGEQEPTFVGGAATRTFMFTDIERSTDLLA